jgi:hypothetical protein
MNLFAEILLQIWRKQRVSVSQLAPFVGKLQVPIGLYHAFPGKPGDMATVGAA